VPNDIKEIEFDEVWRFVGSKKTSFGSLEQLIAVHGKLLPGFWVDEILQHLNDSTKKLGV